MAIDYKSAGVDVEAGYEAVKLMKQYVKKTYDGNVLGDLGSFGGFYALDDREDGDCLVAGTDGVGTKLKYAFVLDKHDTIGIDAVAMCVNDIVCQGAKPLLFLDYIALSKLEPNKVATIVKGVAEGCCQSGCALIGGETAEMPGFYAKDEYDIAGFAVGIVNKKKIINGKNIKVGDKLIGLASSGIHSNGYSLVRKLFGEDKESLNKYNETLGCTPAEVVLTPTRIYVKTILSIIEKFEIKGIAHITGGGFIENVPRIIPNGMGVHIDRSSYPLPKLFKALQEIAGIDDTKMCNTFNMGIGMVLAVDPQIANAVTDELNAMGEKAYIIGEVTDKEGVEL
ncbi:MAG: phosphoribosylformylglycinamidine cyclo-ligase [Clostridia bacterium]|nr:phosphoribosylformylglycinamidine cyclo-ligase [Clostridia bacterium]MDY4083817.1 phosphoribosylformylglycinamidine cyclo-ligase [Eubacteriales bacterium]